MDSRHRFIRLYFQLNTNFVIDDIGQTKTNSLHALAKGRKPEKEVALGSVNNLIEEIKTFFIIRIQKFYLNKL